jgi:hypothetical protein
VYQKAERKTDDLMNTGRSMAQTGREQLEEIQSGLPQDRTPNRF